MGLKKLTGRAMPTLIIAANLPDVDAYATFLGTYGLTVRRGITHGPLGLLLLPLLLTGLMLLYNRWRPSEQAVRPGYLLLLAYIGTLSHPALDWLNSYGIRLLEPFSSRWYAGDTLFIIDVWVWAALIGCFVWSRLKEKRGGNWQRPAWFGFVVISGYILANGLITGRAEATTRDQLEAQRVIPTQVVANPVPVRFWERRMLWRTIDEYGDGHYDALSGALRVENLLRRTNLERPEMVLARSRQDVQDYLFWSRMPIVVTLPDGRAFLADQRFSGGLYRNQFVIELNSPPAPADGSRAVVPPREQAGQ